MNSKFLAFSFIALFISTLSANPTPEAAFTNIYKNGIWGRNEKGEGFSGGGSTFQATKGYIEFLENFIIENNIRSVIDIGCGDWTFSRFINWGDIEYQGYDVVKSVIDKNRASFSTPRIRFIHGNAIALDLPSADLLLCKDVLQHLPNKEIQLLLPQLSKFRHCLITNDVDPNTLSSSNPDIAMGEFRFLDLTQPPFKVKGTKILTYMSGDIPKQVLHIQRSND